MKAFNVIQLAFGLIAILLATQAFAVKPFEVTCGDGETIEVADSDYHLADLACLAAGHPPQQQATAKLPANNLKAKRQSGRKIIPASQALKRAGDNQQQSSTVDHSDFILMAQGCKCISPHCVAYSCPADVDVP